ncbi:poly polymerase 2 [Nephila pilipes]|uniref:Poly [ADP-ribose] polymerase n=1 Tax=Nephila pilipes TaxID=299642 RepID=A0A8X6QF17_NEPPI|nr:poly polymerase 2 [Nephila pilipes]
MSDELPDFIWQHHYGKRWITYPEECSQVLNKAVRKWQKTVTIPDNSPKKCIVVHLDKMYQINQVSSKRRKVRCVIYSDDFYTWSWLDDDGEWSSYKPRLVFFLEVAHHKEGTEFNFFDNGKYKVYLNTMIQINEETNFSRRILRETVDITCGMSIFDGIKMANKFKEMCSNPSVCFSRSYINLPSVSQMHSSLSINLGDIHVPTPSTSCESDEVIDECLPPDQGFLGENFCVYQENGIPYTATLNYVNMSANNNKFYITQVLKHKSKKEFKFWQRFGRVGTHGQSELKNFASSLPDAKAAFEEKFHEKTGNDWNNIKNFNYMFGKYDLLKIDLNPEISCKKETAEVDLESSIKSLMELICNKKMMNEILKEMFYDSSNAPLGKLTFRQIKDGYIALNKIAQVVSQNGDPEELLKYCEEFYMKIPHNFGKKNPPVIQTKEDIEQKMEMLKALTNIRLAMTVLNEESEYSQHPFNRCYNSFKYSLELLDPTGEKYAALDKCLKQTHGPTHSTYKMELIDAFQCHEKDSSSFKDYGNNFLLWHGSRITNWVGILQKGLKIAPPEAPSTGDYFGKGLYFADISSKSANYCLPTKKNNQGLLLLCKVSLGNKKKMLLSDSTLPDHFQSFNSVLGMGRIVPTDFQTGILSLNAKVPVGPLKEYPLAHDTLKYNEYVVYDVNQVKPKYLLRVKFNFV